MIRAILPSMLQRQSGHIINVGSIAGYEGYPGGTVYCATKFAVRAVTEALRKELVSTPLRVSSVNPGKTNCFFNVVNTY